MNSILRLFLWLALLTSVNAVPAPLAHSTMEILQSLYNSTNGILTSDVKKTQPWNWNFTKNALGEYLNDPCHTSWSYVTCTCQVTFCNVTDLSVTFANISAGSFIPSSLGSLVSLQSLSLSPLNAVSGKLSGTLPAELFNLTNLHYLGLAGNALSSSIPASLGNLQQLNHLDLSGNKLTSIPLEICSLSKLRIVSLQFNRISGALPSMSCFENLLVLSLDHNAISGSLSAEGWVTSTLLSFTIAGNALSSSIPHEICMAQQLEEISLSSNMLSGSLPSCIGNFSSPINSFDVSFNQLSGNLPSVWRRGIATFAANNNAMSGVVPLAFLQSCRAISIQNNRFNEIEGGLPCSGSVSQTIDMHGNALGGVIGNLSACVTLSSIDLSSNPSLHISAGFALPHSILSVNISFTSINGPYPKALLENAFSHLFLLSMSNAGITGPIPIFQSSLYPVLVWLDLSGNLLEKGIPESIGTLTSLNFLALNDNRLSGLVPDVLSTLPLGSLILRDNDLRNGGTFNFVNYQTLILIDVANNAFTGSIPPALFNKNMQVLSIASNCFSGSLPASVCEATNLVTFSASALTSGRHCRGEWSQFFREKFEFTAYVQGSLMEGEIPTCLYKLPKIKQLLIMANNLAGELPDTISPSLKTLAISSNQVTGQLSKEVVSSASLKSLDVSFNSIRGTLDAFSASAREGLRDFRSNPINFSGRVNDLSGVIPEAVRDLRNVVVLDGSLFTCPDGREDLPPNDPDVEGYSCAADSLNVLLYIAGAVLVLVPLMLFVSIPKRFLKVWQYRNEITHRLHVAEGHLSIFPGLNTSSIIEYSNYLYGLRVVSLKILSLVVVAAVAYLAMTGHEFRTMTHTFTWVLSSAFLFGKTPTYLLLVLWGVILAATAIFIRQDHMRVNRTMSDPGLVAQAAAPPALPSPSAASKPTAVVFGQPPAAEKEERDESLRLLPPPETQAAPCCETLRCILRVLVYCLITIGVISMMNVAYVQVLRFGNEWEQKSFRLFFALFKIWWSASAIPKLYYAKVLYFGMDYEVHEAFVDKVGGKIRIIVLVNMLSLFLLPILVAVVMSTSCMAFRFVERSDAPTLSYDYVVDSLGSSVTVTQEVNVVQSSPFLFSTVKSHCFFYILTAYTPLYGQMYMFHMAKSLAHFLFILFDISRNLKAHSTALSGERKPSAYEMLFIRTMPLSHLYYTNALRRQVYEKRQPLIFATTNKKWMQQAMISHMDRVILLCTFGVMAPPLACIIFMSMTAETYVEQLLIGQFLSREAAAVLRHASWVARASHAEHNEIQTFRASFTSAAAAGAGAGVGQPSEQADAALPQRLSSRSSGGAARLEGSEGAEVTTSEPALAHAAHVAITAGGAPTDDSSLLSRTPVNAHVAGTASPRASGNSFGIRMSAAEASMSEEDKRRLDAAPAGAEADKAAAAVAVAAVAAVASPEHLVSEEDEIAMKQALEPWGAQRAIREVLQQCEGMPPSTLKGNLFYFLLAQGLMYSLALSCIATGLGVDVGSSFCVISIVTWMCIVLVAAYSNALECLLFTKSSASKSEKSEVPGLTGLATATLGEAGTGADNDSTAEQSAGTSAASPLHAQAHTRPGASSDVVEMASFPDRNASVLNPLIAKSAPASDNIV